MPPAPKKEEAQAGEAQAPEELGLSRQAQFSTYKEDAEANAEAADRNPPDGPHIVQELGKASEGPVRLFEYGGGR
jgi:hypothetical protein